MFDTNGELYLSDPGGNTTPEHPFWVAEFIGDVAVVNGAAWPKMKVEPKRYRFLFLNGSNSVGYNLQVATPGTANPDGTFTYGTKGPDMWVIGTDGGYLDAPAKAYRSRLQSASGTVRHLGDKLVLLPGERYEVIIDFTDYAGQILEMQNDAWNPYPFGDAPPIPQIMQFEVKAKAKSPGVVYDPDLPEPARASADPIVDLEAAHGARRRPPSAHPQRGREHDLRGAPRGAAQQHQVGRPPDHRETVRRRTRSQSRGDFKESRTTAFPPSTPSFPDEGTMEVWDIINITADAHPIHLHLVQFQIIERIPVRRLGLLRRVRRRHSSPTGIPATCRATDPRTTTTMPNAAGAVGGNPDPLQSPRLPNRRADRAEARRRTRSAGRTPRPCTPVR